MARERQQLMASRIHGRGAAGCPRRRGVDYDGSGKRVRKVAVKGSIVETRLYLGGFEIYRKKVNGALEMERETLHVMDDKDRVALAETLTIDAGAAIANPVPVVRYQLDNHLGSASLELDDSANIVSYEEYYPYGDTSYQAGRSASEVSQKRYRYTGKEKDEESGLYYHGARYYACWLGRWTASDPAGLVDGVNLYMYVRGNPVKLHDPSGNAGVMVLDEIEVKGKGPKPIRDSKVETLSSSRGRVSGNFAQLNSSKGNPVHGGIQKEQSKGIVLGIPEKTQLALEEFKERLNNGLANNSQIVQLMKKMVEHYLNMNPKRELTWIGSVDSQQKPLMYRGIFKDGHHTMGPDFTNILKEKAPPLVVHLHPEKEGRAPNERIITMFSIGDQMNMAPNQIWLGIEIYNTNKGIEADIHASSSDYIYETGVKIWDNKTGKMESEAVIPSIMIMTLHGLKPIDHSDDFSIVKMREEKERK